MMERKRTASIRVRDVAGLSRTKLKSGDVVNVSINTAQYQLGYDNPAGKPRFDFITPNWDIKHWSDELKFDGHFCFVDTNPVKSPLIELSTHSHVTGIYIFQLEKLEFQRDETWTKLTWKPNWRKSVINFTFTTGSDDGAEKRGWHLALGQLAELRATKAKIFVDKHQNELAELSKSLPKGWDYYYTSSDRGQTLFNLIFRRLDKAINIVAASGLGRFEKVDIEKYLMGNVPHLKSQR